MFGYDWISNVPVDIHQAAPKIVPLYEDKKYPKFVKLVSKCAVAEFAIDRSSTIRYPKANSFLDLS